jgi:hypothetical protein
MILCFIRIRIEVFLINNDFNGVLFIFASVSSLYVTGHINIDEKKALRSRIKGHSRFSIHYNLLSNSQCDDNTHSNHTVNL